MKYLFVLAALLFSIPAFSETDYLALPKIRVLEKDVKAIETKFDAGATVTNVIIAANGKTNTIVVTSGLITSWTVVP